MLLQSISSWTTSSSAIHYQPHSVTHTHRHVHCSTLVVESVHPIQEASSPKFSTRSHRCFPEPASAQPCPFSFLTRICICISISMPFLYLYLCLYLFLYLYLLQSQIFALDSLCSTLSFACNINCAPPTHPPHFVPFWEKNLLQMLVTQR